MNTKEKSESIDITKFDSVEDWMKSISSRLNWFERNIEIPFYRHFWNHVTEFYYGLKHLPGNIKKWGKFVWYDRDWDSCYTLEALEIKCRAQSKYLENGNADGCEIYAVHALDCADALKRLRESEYIDYHYELHAPIKRSGDEIEKEFNDKRNADLEIIRRSFEEIGAWWD